MVESRHVLVIDDANLVRRYYRQALEGAGFAVSEALNGVEALEKVLAERFDLLIVDVNMPYMDGLSFLKALRRQDGLSGSVPALVITTEAEAQDRTAARLAGGNFYLVKAVSPQMLVEYAGLMCGPPRAESAPRAAGAPRAASTS
jgi:two-component system chemotaxis response regulator CheY